jgi:hypothetical protein
MALSECPHCHTSVYPKDDGTCPSCRRNTRDLRGADTDRASVSLAEQEPLPPVCILCGHDTDRTRKIACSYRPERDENTPGTGLAVMAMITGLFTGLLLLLATSPSSNVLMMRVPLCRRCRLKRKEHVRHVDFPNRQMTFLAHRVFRDRLLERRASESSTAR